ncbi:MAG: hypothetical protein Ct9H300mP28_35930 [Pseudomonadota bacterium]|nr:MAG: hypothetical protein Ct9H300mP28_35930 [Pseudomonadota bacterium]
MTARESEAIATLFLSKMQMIYIAEPHQLCIKFFHLDFTLYSGKCIPSVPEDDDLKQTKFAAFNKFRRELTKSDQWSSLCGMYLDVLDEIAGKRNESNREKALKPSTQETIVKILSPCQFFPFPLGKR